MTVQIGFIGLGAMGLPMATTLVSKQFSVRGFDMRSEALAALVESGGKSAKSAAEAADGVEILVLMVVNTAQAQSVLFEAGALAATKSGAVVVLMATCAPSDVRDLAARIAGEGRFLVDAPVSGGINGAKTGTLTIMAAAAKPVFERCRPILSAMGDKLFHVGEEAGQGAVVKTVNQLLCGVHIAVAAEGLAFAEKAGVDPRLAFEILSGSAAQSWMFNNRGPRMLEEEPLVSSAVDIFVKDLGIVSEAGRATKTPLPIANAALQMFVAASAEGLGTKDDSQVIAVYRKMAGLNDNQKG